MENKAYPCVFTYDNTFASDYTEQDVADVMNEFWEILRLEENSNWVSIPGLALIYIMNMPPEENVYDTLRLLISTTGN